ncbi:MAG: NAD-dependent epimerase/dehydratase family protein [Polyangiales bacterium]
MSVRKLEGTVLVTGGSGFIGRRLCGALEAAGSEVVSVRRAGSPTPSWRSVVADYSDVDQLTSLMAAEKPAYLFHVAGVTKGRTYDDFRDGNVVPTEHLVRALERAHPGIERFVLVSSLTSYGPSRVNHPLHETDPREPIEFYGQSKLEAERVVEGSSLPFTIARPAGVYGPGDVDYFNLFQSAMSGINAFFGNRHRLGSMIYVDDCVRAIVECAAHENTVGKGYFLSTGEPVSWEVLQDAIVSQMDGKTCTIDLPEQVVHLAAFGGDVVTRIDGKPRLLNRQKAKMGAQDAWTCSADAAREDFGFVGETQLADGVAETHAWYTANGWYRQSWFSGRSLGRFLRRLGGGD